MLDSLATTVQTGQSSQTVARGRNGAKTIGRVGSANRGQKAIACFFAHDLRNTPIERAPMNDETLKAITRTRKWAHKKFLEEGSKTYRAFVALEESTFTDGALAKKQKELIAIGISVRLACESCMQWHIEQAANDGASYEEVLEAIEVGIEMGGGPATVSARFALMVMAEVYGK